MPMTETSGISALMSARVFAKISFISPATAVSMSKSTFPPAPFNFNSGAKTLPISFSERFFTEPSARIFSVFISAEA